MAVVHLRILLSEMSTSNKLYNTANRMMGVYSTRQRTGLCARGNRIRDPACRRYPQSTPIIMRKTFKTLPKVFKKRTKREDEDAALLRDVVGNYQLYLFPTSRSVAFNDNDDDDTDSISSFSTMATADNIPGTGRSVDMYFYQPVGRWIETFAMRLTISSLNPAQIFRFLGERIKPSPMLGCYFRPLHDVIQVICDKHGSTCVAGLKSLVKQTQ